MPISAGGAGDSYAWMPLFFKGLIKTTSLRCAYRDLDLMEAVFRDAGLDVCCPRPTGLTDEPATGQARAVTKLTGQAQIPRADVAGWVLDELEKPPPFAEFGPVITVTGG